MGLTILPRGGCLLKGWFTWKSRFSYMMYIDMGSLLVIMIDPISACIYMKTYVLYAKNNIQDFATNLLYK